MNPDLKDTLHRMAMDAARRAPRDQLIADLRARIARLERSNAELAKANHVLQDLAKGDL